MSNNELFPVTDRSHAWHLQTLIYIDLLYIYAFIYPWGW